MSPPGVHVMALSLEKISLTRLEALAQPLGVTLLNPASSGRQRQYLGGRIAAFALLKHLGLEQKITADPKLGYLRCPSGHLSITHTEGIAMAAWASQPVGIDVEVTDRDASKVIGRFLTAEESQWMKRTGTPNPALVLWVVKEAVSKACGLGLSLGMTEYNAREESPGRFGSPVPGTSPFPMDDPVIELVPWEDHLVAVCSERKVLLEGIQVVPLDTA